ncbi:hypothetical protein U1Q18_046562, partial [Sarracenia purpurea var. burkii]
MPSSSSLQSVTRIRFSWKALLALPLLRDLSPQRIGRFFKECPRPLLSTSTAKKQL